MSSVFPGRYTAHTDEPFVVFLIGMRINRFFAFHKWVPTASAMGPKAEPRSMECPVLRYRTRSSSLQVPMPDSLSLERL